MKKTLVILVSVILVLALGIAILSGCKTQATETTAAATTAAAETTAAAGAGTVKAIPEALAAKIKAGAKLKIGLLMSTTDGFYVKKYIQRYDELIAEKKYDSVMLDSGFDAAKQVSQMDNLIAQKVDIIFLMPNDPKALMPSAKKAQEAGIPVLSVHDKLDVSGEQYTIGFAGADSSKLGEGAGQLMNEALGGKGSIVVLGSSYAATYGINIYTGFKSKIPAEIKILAEGDHGWDRAKALAVMEDFLTKYDNIDGAFSFDDNTGLGVIDAIKAANRTGIKVVSINGQKEAFDVIKSGDLYGTVKLDPVANVNKAFESLELFLTGKAVPQYNYSDSPMVTKANIDSMEPSF